MSEPVLLQLVADLVGGRISVVDLTQTLSPDFPQIVLPPEMGQAWPFRVEEARAMTSADPPGTGTTSPAASTPARISTRRSTGSPAGICPTTAPTPSRPRHFIAPACVLDCSREAAADADFLLTVGFLRDWEKRHGRIPRGHGS
jgi:hypothetical protein